MSKYIDADKLIAEIQKRIEETKSMKPSFDQFWAGQISAFKGCLSIIASLQQEQPKIDLEKEISDTCRSYRIRGYFEGAELDRHDIENIANYYYELGYKLGLNARKEE